MSKTSLNNEKISHLKQIYSEMFSIFLNDLFTVTEKFSQVTRSQESSLIGTTLRNLTESQDSLSLNFNCLRVKDDK